MTYKIVKAPYRVKAPYGYEIDMTHFEELCAEIMQDGYRPTGGVQFLHSGYELREDLALQAFYKVNIPDFVGMADSIVEEKSKKDKSFDHDTLIRHECDLVRAEEIIGMGMKSKDKRGKK